MGIAPTLGPNKHYSGGARSQYDAVELLEPVYPGVFIFKVHHGDFTIWPLQ